MTKFKDPSSLFSMKFPAILVSLLFSPLLLSAQDTLALEEAMQKAVNENHSVQVARNQRLISENNAHIGNAGLLPRVELRSSGDYSRENTTQEFAGQIPDSELKGAESRTANASVNLDYTLFDGMSRINEYKKLKAQKKLGKVQARNKTENILMDVVNGYYELARTQGQCRITRKNMALSKERLQRIKNRYEYGKANKVEVLSAQVDLDSDSSSYLQARLDMKQAKRTLNLLMGTPPSKEIAVMNEVTIQRDMKKDSLIETALEQNARLTQAKKDQKVAELDLKVANGGNYPDLSLTGNYSYSRTESDAGILNLNQSDGLSAGISFSYPIFTGFQQNIREKNARIRVESSKEQLQEVEKELRRDLLNAWQNYQTRLRMLGMEERNVENAKRNFEQSRERYEMGQIDATQFREAQVNLTQAQIRRLNSKYQAKSSEMQLLKLVGNLKEETGIE